jgi:hypothetical protein
MATCLCIDLSKEHYTLLSNLLCSFNGVSADQRKRTTSGKLMMTVYVTLSSKDNITRKVLMATLSAVGKIVSSLTHILPRDLKLTPHACCNRLYIRNKHFFRTFSRRTSADW